jgi:ABC-type multidrug transport system ATPase subunit
VSAVELQAVTKSYGSVRALDALDLEVPEGSTFGLIGPNGAGKTTTLNILAGWVRPSRGRARVLAVEPPDPVRLKGRAGFLPQDAALPPHATVREALRYYARLQGLRGDAPVDAALAAGGAKEFADATGGSLSHGMQKRAQLAQALLGGPALLVLDEPTAGLDPRSAHEVRRLIAGARGKRTVIVSSHNLHELEEICDHAGILDHGRLVRQGTMADLVGRGEELRLVLGAGPAPVDAVRALPGVASCEWETASRALVVRLGKDAAPAEEMIAQVLRALLDAGARPVELRRGARLEERVLAMTSRGSG